MPEFREKYTKREMAATIGVCGDMMWTRVPDLPKGSDNSWFGGVTTQFDPAFEQLGSKPRNRSTTTPLVIDRRCTVDLAKKAKSLPANREHTQEHKGMQPNCRWMINLTKLGSHKSTTAAKLLSTE
jgi:hypothetical protein